MRPELSQELQELQDEPGSITLVEWAEKNPAKALPDLQIEIKDGDTELARQFNITAVQPQGQEILKLLQEKINDRALRSAPSNSLV